MLPKKSKKKDADFDFDEEIINEEKINLKQKDEIKILKSERKEYLDGWQRERAELANYKKKSNELLKNENIQGRIHSINSFLPALDSFELAMKNKDKWNEVDKNWRIGVEYIYQQLIEALNNLGVDRIDETDVKFEPQIHEAVGTVDTDDELITETIEEIIKKGYKFNNIIIRPAQVIIRRLRK